MWSGGGGGGAYQKAAGLFSRAQLILTCQDSGHQSEIRNEYDMHVDKFFPVPVAREMARWSGVVNEMKQEVKRLRKVQAEEMEAVQAKVESIESKLDAMLPLIEGKLDNVVNRLGQQ